MLDLKINQRQLYEVKVDYNIAFVSPEAINRLFVIPEIEEFALEEQVIMNYDPKKIYIKEQLLNEFPTILDGPIFDYDEEEKRISIVLYSSQKIDEHRLRKVIEDRIEEMGQYHKLNSSL